MDRELMDRWCERGITGLVLVMLLFTPLAFGGRPQPPAGVFFDFLLLDTFQLAQWLTAGILVLWGARLWLKKRPQLLFPPICWAVLAFTGYTIGRYLTSDIEYVARQEMIHVLVYCVLFFAILNNLHRQETIQVVCLALIFLGMLISCYAVYQFMTDSTRVWHVFTQYKHRASGTYICPNHLGGLLEMLLPLGLAFLIAGRLSATWKVFVGYATLVIMAGIAATISRGTWVAAGLALMVFFVVLIFQRPYRVPAFLFLGIILSAAVVVTPKNFNSQIRYKKLVVEGKFDDDLRFFMWEPALRVWQEDLWWGAGPGHFDYRFRQHRPESVQLSPDRVHNDYLNVLTDWGIVGGALVFLTLLLLGIGVIRTWRVVRRGADLGGKTTSNKFAVLVGAGAALMALSIHSLVDFNMHIPANALVAVAWMALLSSQLRFVTERYWMTLATWAKVLVSILFLAGVGYLGDQSARRAGENFWLAKFALDAQNPYSPAQVEVLKKAYAIEPMNFETTYAIGEAYRIQSHEEGGGGEEYKELAGEAMVWFQRGMKLNPWDGYNFLRYGWCLDWTSRQDESGPYFDKAEQLDPNGYYTMAFIGLHYLEARDFAAAKPWFERSLRLEWVNNDIPKSYLPLVDRKLLEDATNEISAKLSIPSP